MAWVKIQNSITKQILTIPQSAYANLCRKSNVFVKVEETKSEVKQKSTKLKENKKDVDEIQFNKQNERRTSRENKKKIGV